VTLDLVTMPVADLPVPSLDDPDVEVWRDVDGVVCAVGYRRGSGYGLQVPNVGTFFFRSASNAIMLVPNASAADELIQDAFHRIAVPLALQLRGPQVLHASAVVAGGGVVAVCGRSGAGKSTLGYCLSRRGNPLWGDDAVAFETHDDCVEVHPLPFRMRLRPQSAQWFDALDQQKGSELSSPWLGGSSPKPFRALVVLERDESSTGDDVQLVRLGRADAFSAVLPHAYYVALSDENLNRRLLSAYLELADLVPVFALRYTPRLGLVERMAELVEREVAAL
jgi:hypothetical protein